MRENCRYEAKGPVLFPKRAVVGRSVRPHGNPVKGPWWAVPGVVAIIGTLAIVSAAQGSLSTAKVTLPGAVQVPTAGAAARSRSTLPSSTGAEDGKVVAPSRPVVSQTDSPTSDSSNSGSGTQTGPTSGSDQSTANPTPQSQSGSGATASPESGASSTSPGTGSSDPSGEDPSTTGPITTTPTPTTSTTTTKPPTRPEPGDQ
jgi:hypothetical protein